MEIDHDGHDDSWKIAYEVVQAAAKTPPSLPHIMRTCWNGVVTPSEFVRLMGAPGYSTRCLLRAAHIQHAADQIEVTELEAAVDVLGVKASAVILAINCICERTLDTGPSARIWAPLFKEMMTEIEIGYHFGLSFDRVGHEQGMIVGFSRLAGLAVLLGHYPKQFGSWYGATAGHGTSQQALDAFRCEPYQVSSMLMQHLGLGTEVALATASTLGDIHASIVEVKPAIATWRATYRWVHALKDGKSVPDCESARETFSELCIKAGETRVPSHISMLLQQVAELRKSYSAWTWHLPLSTYEETAKAIVYRVNSNACGTTWTKALA